ncbi:MAG: phosphatidate cytidylyltransferase [Robiginitomaculum sp.]
MSSFRLRSLSGIALVLICLLPIYFGGTWFLVLLYLMGVRMIYEWVRMTDESRDLFAFAIPVAALTVSLYFGYKDQWALALSVVIVASLLALLEKIRRGSSLWAGGGVLYIVFPCLALYWLRGNIPGFTSVGFAKLMFVLSVVIATDSFAYLGGSTIGGPKLAPKISPNKTWAGFISGLIFGAITGGIFAYIMGFSIWFGVVLAVPIVIFSVIGDFFESGIKRHLGVKDTGRIMPGHGGLLDRTDALMFASVIAVIVLVLWPNLWPLVIVVG